MYKIGFRFEVTKNGMIGVITGYSSGIYGVAFYEDNELYLIADVHEGTITNNLATGAYKEL
jgi:hypothetical protein